MILLTIQAKNARLAGLRDAIDTGGGTAHLRLYAGPQPPLGQPPGGGHLVSISLPAPCGTVANGELALSVPSWVVVSASGTLAWGRITSRAGEVIADLTVGVTGSGQAIECNSLAVAAGGLLAITNAVLRE